MSKTTRKYGKPLYTVYLRCDATVVPSPALLRSWAKLDHYAKQDYNKPYDALSDAQKLQVHYNLNTGTYREQEKKEREEAKVRLSQNKRQPNSGSVQENTVD